MKVIKYKLWEVEENQREDELKVYYTTAPQLHPPSNTMCSPRPQSSVKATILQGRSSIGQKKERKKEGNPIADNATWMWNVRPSRIIDQNILKLNDYIKEFPLAFSVTIKK